MNGPGKYDDLCAHVRQQAKARGVILIVIEGEHGNGFSAQLPAELGGTIPAALVAVAHEMAKDLRQQGVPVVPEDAVSITAEASPPLCAVCGEPYAKHLQPGDYCATNFHYPGRSYYRTAAADKNNSSTPS